MASDHRTTDINITHACHMQHTVLYGPKENRNKVVNSIK